MAPQPPPRTHKIPLAGPLTIFLLGGLVGLLAAYDAALSAPWLLWLADVEPETDALLSSGHHTAWLLALWWLRGLV